MIQFGLPWPPSVNHYWIERVIKSRKSGKHIVMKAIGAKGKGFRKRVEEIVGDVGDPLLKNLLVTVKAFPPDKRKRDIDNILKALLDALEHAGVYENDNQISTLTISKHSPDPEKEGYVIVEIAEVIN